MTEITFELACRDDCFDKLIPSDLRHLVAERDRLKKSLDDALIALALEATQRKALLGVTSNNEWAVGIKMGEYLVSISALTKDNAELKDKIRILNNRVAYLEEELYRRDTEEN